MQQYLENLRKKPKAVRAQVAFGAAGSITAVFFLIWAFGLSDRMSVDSNDPTIAAYERDIAQKELTTRSQEAGFGSLFGQLKRGVANVIFSSESTESDQETFDDKVIDINAMIENPNAYKTKPSATATESIVVPVGEDDRTGSVILIGTTTTSNHPETSE